MCTGKIDVYFFRTLNNTVYNQYSVHIKEYTHIYFFKTQYCTNILRYSTNIIVLHIHKYTFNRINMYKQTNK